MSGRNLDFQSSCRSAIIISHLQGPLVSHCPQPRIYGEGEQRQNTWPYRGQIRETKHHPTKGTRQIPSGYGQAPATVCVGGEEEGSELGEGKATGEAGNQYEKEEITEENYMLAPPRKAVICFW